MYVSTLPHDLLLTSTPQLVVNPLDKPNPPKKKKKKTAAPAPLPTDNNIPPPKTVPSAKPPALSAKPSAKPAKTASASNGAATGAARVVGMTIQSDNEEDEEDEEDTGAGGPGNLAWDERAEDVDAPRPDDGDDDEEEWEDIERQLNELEVAPPKSRGRTHAGGAGKRKPSRSPSADADQPHRRPRNSNNSAHGRAKASDYSMRTQAILKVAWGHYRVWLATVNPFPDYEDAYVVAIQAWERACAEIGDDIAIEPEYIKIVRPSNEPTTFPFLSSTASTLRFHPSSLLSTLPYSMLIYSMFIVLYLSSHPFLPLSALLSGSLIIATDSRFPYGAPFKIDTNTSFHSPL